MDQVSSPTRVAVQDAHTKEIKTLPRNRCRPAENWDVLFGVPMRDRQVITSSQQFLGACQNLVVRQLVTSSART
jgi:hypothetical protein